ncbi:MAG TPA: hypothetical protein PKV16_02595 [Caldisericia bacterium]|nr:hypothetical protein [Caldisericia bacterium]HPF48202.1 hypothetical protein [Caldisericia bacterium]HPI83862.1 hypothetical protein [Caldisericia bacterium]HPQ92655.1 hypothetical protein [Caldisericia bacterium]HRV74247.1 hypothetical protein [Caldisericia bacterium]
MNRRHFLYFCVAVGVLSLVLGFVYGSGSAKTGEELRNVTKLDITIPGVRLIPNPTVDGLLDASIEVDRYATDTEISCTAFEVLSKIIRADVENSSFETARIQVKSGMWQTEFSFSLSAAKELKDGGIDLREFWVESVKNQTPKREMINTTARVDTFCEYAESLFNSKSIGEKTNTRFTVTSGKNLKVTSEIESTGSVSSIVAKMLICTQVAAEKSGVYLDKVTIEAKVENQEILVKFDYRYLDLLTDGKISMEEFRGHMYIE